ncbi:hypothetical protein Pcinc_003975 [Petrolisthes cinctipes]|uniref:Uncharacterized protein n=1 Tax=Petrolisthes cinctipes TaxID=88211 RepID=A0AAE1KZ24_PETCI|nr:hypothetical protein Pcinc_006569 [Petrolisthes cinctipes]KAK3892164.1 hypothetical protein Pcinc_003975 [Petrolisthes cinctipes]
MLSRTPEVQHWQSQFTKARSQSIRTERFKRKRKSESSQPQKPSPKRFCLMKRVVADTSAQHVMNVMKFIEKSIGYKKGKGVKSKTVLTVVETKNLSDIDSKQYCSSPNESPPHLLLFMLLGFLQQYVLKDPYNLEKSMDYKHFVAKYESKIKEAEKSVSADV